MDSIFQLDDGGRDTFLQQMLYSFGAAYVCLWSHVAPQPISNCLISMDGLYVEENNQPTCSSGSHARRLFDAYRQSVLLVRGIDGVPGLAFKNGVPYMELKLRDLRRLATVESQLQFYEEARIKTAIFMGCKTGEIELGISNDTQVNLEMEMRNWFPDNFARQIAPPMELPHPTDRPRPSSSSSSLTSLSMGSPEVSPFLFSIPNTSSLLELPHPTDRPRPSSSSSSLTSLSMGSPEVSPHPH